MIEWILGGAAAAITPQCSLGDYVSVCNFTAPRTGAFRIVGDVQAVAKGPAPHSLTVQYALNGMLCAKSEHWAAGTRIARASCVARLNAGTYYHLVATTNARNAGHLGRVSVSIAPTSDSPDLHSAPVAIRVTSP